MVLTIASRIIEKAISGSGVRLIERGVKAFNRYDKQIFKGLYGTSGGRGVRHGRDIGTIAAGYLSNTGDTLDQDAFPPWQPRSPTRNVGKTYSRYKRSNFSRRSQRKRCYPDRRRSRFSN